MAMMDGTPLFGAGITVTLPSLVGLAVSSDIECVFMLLSFIQKQLENNVTTDCQTDVFPNVAEC